MSQKNKSRSEDNGARVQRPPVEQPGPNRSASASFFPGANAGGNGPNSGAVEKAVHTAYRVFDDYVQRAFQTASLYSPMDGRMPNMNEAQDMAGMAMKYWTEMAKNWFGPWTQFSSIMNPQSDSAWDLGNNPFMAAARAAAGAAGAAPAGATAGSAARVAISVEISASQPAEVIVELGDRTPSASLAAQPLQAIDGEGKPPLSAVTLELRDGKLCVTVTVPRDQPAGAYTGAIVDREKNQAIGTLTVNLRSKK